MTDAAASPSSTATRLLRRATSLCVPVLLSVAGLSLAGLGTEPAFAAGPRISVTQAVGPTTYDKAGQVLTWTSVVRNFGSTTLTGLEVTDSVAGLTDRRCAPVAVGGTLAAGATTTCTATYAVTQADLDVARSTSDTVTAAATASEQQGSVRASASATAVATPEVAPGVALTVTASPTTVSLPGQQVAYTFVVRNRGNQTLRHVLVRAPFPGLAALVCSPVPQGGTLAPGATSTCRATRTVAVADLGAAALEDSAKVEATAPTGRRVANTGAVSVAAEPSAPVVSSYVSAAVVGGRPISLPGATTARPAGTGAAAIDPSRTVFVGFDKSSPWAGKQISTPHAVWAIRSDGSVELTPDPWYLGAGVDKVGYRVYDTAGRSAVGYLTVTLRRGATPGAPVTATTVQNHPVTVDVLGHDDPGLDADGTSGSFDRPTLRMAHLDFGPEGDWSRPPVNYLDQGRKINIVGIGDYTTGPAGITFTPVPSFTGTPPPVWYAARSVTGSPVENSLTITVTKGAPAAAPTYGLLATDDHAVTLAHLRANLAGQGNDIGGAPDKGSFPADQLAHLPAGSRVDPFALVVVGEGRYDILGLGPQGIQFTPEPTFTGPSTTPVQYQIEDYAGRTARATLTVTVLAGAEARPDPVTTPQHHPVDVDVTANDVLGPGFDGAPLTRSAYGLPTFASTGQPRGSTLGPVSNTLTVPGEGFYAVNPGDGRISFHPVARFTGVASPVRVTTPVDVPVSSSSPDVLATELPTSTLQVTVTATVPAAHADTASAQVGKPVVVRVLANDVPGSPDVPLVGASLRLRLATGLPTGSTLSGDAKLLTVPERGEFVAAGNGEVTYVPLGTSTGVVPTIGYQVADANGTTTRSTLEVTVG